ncbi:hypothetical protein [Spirosoma areae]
MYTEHSSHAKETSIQELWQQSKRKIKEAYWKKIYVPREQSGEKGYGINFEKDLVTTTFIDAFAVAFEEEIKNNVERLEAEGKPLPKVRQWSIDVTSLSKHFNPASPLRNVKDGTLHLYCLYLGYDSWEDFQVKNHYQLWLQSLPAHRRWWITNKALVIGSLVLCLSAIGGYIYLQSQKPTDAELFELIQKANQAEYGAYKTLPVIDSSSIDQCFFPGIAKRRITKILKKHAQIGRILIDTLNASGARIVDFQVIKSNRNRATVRTEEYWHLKWYNVNQKTFEKEYERVDEQEYELVKQDNHWKIIDNPHIKKPINVPIDKLAKRI